MERLYRLAPAAVLVLARPEGRACGELLRCKGATRPAEADPGTVRHAGEHLIFNYLHCPDDPASAVVELHYLLGRGEGGALASLAQGPPDPKLPTLLGRSQLAYCLPAFSGWEAISFPMVRNRLCCRVVQRLAAHSRNDAARIDRLLEAHGALLAERSALAGGQTATERHVISGRFGAAIQSALGSAAAASGDSIIVDGLGALAGFSEFAGERHLEAILALEGCGIYFSELEKVALDACRHAFADES